MPAAITRRTANGLTTSSTSSTPSKPPITSSISDFTTTTTTSTTTTTTRTALLPTPTELLLLSIYPLTLLLGSAFSHLSPLTRPPATQSIYSPAHQSFYPPELAPSYFARKRNVFNLYFVKLGWFWCSLALLVFAGFVARGRAGSRSRTRTMSDMSSAEQTAERSQRRRRLAQVALRYLLATGAWVLVTQWFFGPPLVDRGFALTGGVCDVAGAAGAGRVQGMEEEGSGEKLVRAWSRAACEGVGGYWRGGTDISGHVFLLVLGSGMLWFEMLPLLLPGVDGVSGGRVVVNDRGVLGRVAEALTTSAGDTLSRGVNMQPRAHGDQRRMSLRAVKGYATTLALAIPALSWWMLLMTAAFFHTWFEKVSGLVVAFAAVWVVYVLPRAWPPLRRWVGMPGV